MGFKHVGFLVGDSSAKPHASEDAECGGTGPSSTTPSKTRAGMWGRGSPRARAAPGHPTALALGLTTAIILCCYLLLAGRSAFGGALSLPAGLGRQGLRRYGDSTAQTLVIYVFAHTDPEYEGNLRFFLETGVAPDDGCDYLLVVQEGGGVLDTALPALPPNVRAVRHPNECFDWGTFGWAMETGAADTSRYRYVIFMNSSVRGPFLPAYWPADRHWSRALTDRISSDVKLVGATISCEGANQGGVLTGELRANPHVQSYLVATDQTGLALLRGDARVLQCYRDIHDAIWYAELGSSAAVLGAGYNIDSLLLRYQGVDWRDPASWGCNAGINPFAEHMYDGINVAPLEVMFVKVKEFLLEANWTAASTAQKYAAWRRGQGGPLTSNEYTLKAPELRYMKTLHMRARGSACFDFAHYRARNPDLPAWGRDTLWEHFVTHGQHEGRVFRFRCNDGQVEQPVSLAAITAAAAAAQAAQQAKQQQRQEAGDHRLAQRLSGALAAAAQQQPGSGQDRQQRRHQEPLDGLELPVQQLQRAQEAAAAASDEGGFAQW